MTLHTTIIIAPGSSGKTTEARRIINASPLRDNDAAYLALLRNAAGLDRSATIVEIQAKISIEDWRAIDKCLATLETVGEHAIVFTAQYDNDIAPAIWERVYRPAHGPLAVYQSPL